MTIDFITYKIQPMKKFASIIVLFITIYSLTSCASNRGHGCGYWSSAKTPQKEDRAYHFIPQTNTICNNDIATD